MMDASEAFDEMIELMESVGEVVTATSPLRSPSATVRPSSHPDEVFYFRVYERFNKTLVLCIDVPLGLVPRDNVLRERLRDKVEWLPFCDVRCDRSGTDLWHVYLTHSLLINEALDGEAIEQVVGSLMHTKNEILGRPATAPFFRIVPQPDEASNTRDLSDDFHLDSVVGTTDDADDTDDGTSTPVPTRPAPTRRPSPVRTTKPTKPTKPAGTSGDSGDAVDDVDDVLLDGTTGDTSWKNPALRVIKRRMTVTGVVRELESLQGLRPVKDAARQLIANHRVQQQRKRAGMKVQQPAPHLVFTGNPGTGKTTVARLFGQLYRSIGLLSKGHVVEAKRSDLVAAYLGQTALRTRAICEKALDGVLFIDEAYSLLGRDYDYGAEVVQELLTQMETHRGRLVVIIAGYPAEIEQLLASNPGLKSRFDRTVHFPDFSDSELLGVLDGLVAENDYVLLPEARELAEHVIATLERGPAFGNARDVRKMFEELLQVQAFRLARKANPTVDELKAITAADLTSLLGRRQPAALGGGSGRHGTPGRGDALGGYL